MAGRTPGNRAITPTYNPQYVSAPHRLELSLLLAGSPVTIHANTIDPSSRHFVGDQRHSNADYEVHFLLNGQADFEVCGDVFPMDAGYAVLIPPGAMHCVRRAGDGFERFTLRFLPRAESPLHHGLQADPEKYRVFACPEETRLLCRKICSEFSENHPFREDSLIAGCTQLLVQIFRHIGLEQPVVTDPVPVSQEQRQVIMDRFFFPWPYSYGTEKDLAELLHVSTRQLHRILHSYYGMSFRQKLLQSRMEYAGSLLQTTRERVCDIAAQVGYKEESSFFKAFQAYYGMTPQQYRLQAQNP